MEFRLANSNDLPKLKAMYGNIIDDDLILHEYGFEIEVLGQIQIPIYIHKLNALR